ncbi:NAD(P)-binding protein [Cadophora sp. DSE1049]|nr:NAD(P)-binding protein [Cadophora sp. DSE1049]
MSHRILITGASGYLGGDFLARLPTSNLPPYEKLYALVRTDNQAAAVKKYGAEPLRFAVNNQAEVHDAIVKNGITVVFYLIDALKNEGQMLFINALAELKKQTGKEVHFMHVSGAKIFSSLAGAPTDAPLLDTRPDLYDIQKKQKAPFGFMQQAVETNNTVIELCEAKGIKAYIFAPCIVYGKSEGFGNPISIQTVAIVKAAKAAGAVYSPNKERYTWPVCHVSDNSTLFIRILHGILTGEKIGSGKIGYYLASPGSVAWDDLYAAMAQSLAKRNVIKSAAVEQATDAHLVKMGAGIGCPRDIVVVQLGGSCAFTPAHGTQIGWKPQYRPEHILEAADAEVEMILANL